MPDAGCRVPDEGGAEGLPEAAPAIDMSRDTAGDLCVRWSGAVRGCRRHAERGDMTGWSVTNTGYWGFHPIWGHRTNRSCRVGSVRPIGTATRSWSRGSV